MKADLQPPIHRAVMDCFNYYRTGNPSAGRLREFVVARCLGCRAEDRALITMTLVHLFEKLAAPKWKATSAKTVPVQARHNSLR
jgi:hypothetical protein